MADNIIIHLHYIRLGDDMDLFFFLLFFVLFFSGTCRSICFLFFVFFGIFSSCFVGAECFKHLKKERKQKRITQTNRSCRSIFMYSDVSFFFLFCMFYLHKRRVFCTIGLSRLWLCACCIWLFLCVLVCIIP